MLIISTQDIIRIIHPHRIEIGMKTCKISTELSRIEVDLITLLT